MLRKVNVTANYMILKPITNNQKNMIMSNSQMAMVKNDPVSPHYLLKQLLLILLMKHIQMDLQLNMMSLCIVSN